MIATLCIAITGLLASATPAWTAELHGIDGTKLSWPWALPFIGILLSIATGPLLFPRIWHRRYAQIAALWSLLALTLLAAVYGIPVALTALVHTIVAEYLSFIIVLFALYTVAGGILVSGNLRGTPGTNTAILGIGTLIASIVGTTGAAMILIRPLIRANESRRYKTHIFVFFIILVANIGGALTPLGDPPLFMGFLRGVDFFWTARNLWLQTAITAVLVLSVFVVLELRLFRWELPSPPAKTEPIQIRVRGSINFLLIALILASILLSAIWKPGVTFSIYGTNVALENLARDVALVLIALASLRLTPNEHRSANGFSWEPIREVAILFAGIFVAIIPVLAMLQAGSEGAFAWLLSAVTAKDGSPHEAAYFWLTGILSAFLDNAPTYLAFFELAGGEAKQLTGPLSGTLAAISMGAVYMGALSYIGNAPNFMVYAIAQERGIVMPSFFGFMVWSGLVLLPIFLLLTFLPIAPLLRFF